MVLMIKSIGSELYKLGNLSKRFSRNEFTCKDSCSMDAIDYELIKDLESLGKIL